MTRRDLLAGLLTARQRSAGAFLLQDQHPDGAWRSAVYGLLSGGYSLTGLVCNSLLDAGHRNDRALRYLLHNTYDDADYPCYAIALALRAIARTYGAGHPRARQLVAELYRQQLGTRNGWSKDHPAFGAWGIGGPIRRPPFPGHVDLSMTRYAVEALAAAGEPPNSEARVFIERCQNPDGGFLFSTVVTDANKAGEGKSYHTATADGVLALRATGGDASRAGRWLAENPGHGFDSPARRRYERGLRFYFAAATRDPSHLPPQRPDGGWANDESLVKEDDPLIATAFALTALS
ncbi:MAG: hypothetical protein FJW30_27860 [Acidobacteria bacterium]|nr:hypothetical protein [Acidobacteriota bacterium]